MKNLTDITILLDRSGSMDAIKSDTIGGYNQFLTTQQKAPNAIISLIQFNDKYAPIYEAKPITEAPALTSETFIPSGTTSLYDALGKSITDTGKRFANMPESDRPDKVVFVIITDGDENSSKIFKKDQILQMVTHQTDVYNWDFVYIGANQDVIASGSGIGISSNNTLGYVSDSWGTQGAFTKLSDDMVSYRGATTKGAFFK
jgi:uncharacterized protein YegL